MQDELLELLDLAEGANSEHMLAMMGPRPDVHASDSPPDGRSILAAMGARKKATVEMDIPVAAEMLGLLRHYLKSLPFQAFKANKLPVAPGIFHKAEAGQVVALLPVQAKELDVIAYWLCQRLQSPKAAALPGTLALPFSIEEHGGQRLLIPEWFSLFYVDSSAAHCVPMLGFQSVLDDSRFADWVPVALARAGTFGLPTAEAVAGAEQVILKKTEPNYAHIDDVL